MEEHRARHDSTGHQTADGSEDMHGIRLPGKFVKERAEEDVAYPGNQYPAHDGCDSIFHRLFRFLLTDFRPVLISSLYPAVLGAGKIPSSSLCIRV